MKRNGEPELLMRQGALRILTTSAVRSDKMTTQDEYAANNKAADLLMPRNLVMKYISEGISGAIELADIFQVSVPAMQVRLRYLLYLP